MPPKIEKLPPIPVTHVNDPFAAKSAPAPRTVTASAESDLSSLWTEPDTSGFESSIDLSLSEIWASDPEPATEFDIQFDSSDDAYRLPERGRFRVDRYDTPRIERPRPLLPREDRPSVVDALAPIARPVQVEARATPKPPPPAPRKTPMERAADYVRQLSVFEQLDQD